MNIVLGAFLIMLLAAHNPAMAAGSFDLIEVQRKIEHKEADTVTFAVSGKIHNHAKQQKTSLTVKAIDKEYNELGRVTLSGSVDAGQIGVLTGQGTMPMESYRRIRGWRSLE